MGCGCEMPAGKLPEKLNMDETYGLTSQRAMPLKPKRFMPRSKLEHIDGGEKGFELILFGAGWRICGGWSIDSDARCRPVSF
ncbi:hypothetical protein EJ110_NYTH46780 [Nymphaea thermarum]|nr:hypothetical protein EJ110_NYTH46780 [Nymphaea thermarum]